MLQCKGKQQEVLIWKVSSYCYWPSCLLSQRGGDMLLYFCPLCLCFSPIHFCQRSLSCRRSNKRRWPNAGLMLAHRLQRRPNIGPVLSYRIVFGATLNVGQRHRQRANINPTSPGHVICGTQSGSAICVYTDWTHQKDINPALVQTLGALLS